MQVTIETCEDYDMIWLNYRHINLFYIRPIRITLRLVNLCFGNYHFPCFFSLLVTGDISIFLSSDYVQTSTS